MPRGKKKAKVEKKVEKAKGVEIKRYGETIKKKFGVALQPRFKVPKGMK